MWWTFFFFNDKYGKFCFKEINNRLMNNENKNPLRNITICFFQNEQITI